MQINEEIITLSKAVKWLENQVFAGFDSMCLDFDCKSDCIKKFIEDMKNPEYGINKYNDEDGW